jgi:hypothetical protein
VEPGRAHLTETESFSDEYLRIRALFAKVGWARPRKRQPWVGAGRIR